MKQGQARRLLEAREIAPAIPGIALLLSALVLLSACATGPGRIVASPLSSEQQQQAVLDIVPLGTSRVDAEKSLQKAGISMSPGSNATISYCALWNRDDGERWEMNVALLFDRSGRLYKVRPANATADYAEAMPGVNSTQNPPTEPGVRPVAPITQTGWQPAGTLNSERADRPREAFPGRPSPSQSR